VENEGRGRENGVMEVEVEMSSYGPSAKL